MWLGLSIGGSGRALGNLARIHVGGLSVVLLRAERMRAHVIRGSHWVARRMARRLSHAWVPGHWCLGAAGHWLRGGGLGGGSFGVCCSFFSRDNVDEEIKHVGFSKCRGNVGPLQGAALVLLCMDPCAHSEFRNEDVTALGEKNRCFGGNHLDFWVGLHDLLDTRKGQLMDLVVVSVAFQVADCLLPVGC